MSDLIDDLLNLHGPGRTNYICMQAADEIGRLRELEQRWRNEYGEAMDQLRQRSDECDTLRSDLAAARAESAKMRRWLDDAELAERREQCRAERAEADLAAAQNNADNWRLQCDYLQAKLAAARALLKEARPRQHRHQRLDCSAEGSVIMDYDELVKRLRVGTDGCLYRDGPDELMGESADAITKLQARVAELEADRRNLLDNDLKARFCVQLQSELNDAEANLAAARADATLLRSTLIDIAAVMGMSSLPSYSEWEKIRNKALQLVAALAGEKK